MPNDPWVVRPYGAVRRPLRLFCFPYAGGGASVFRGWPQAVSPELEIIPVQLPGRENRLREAPFTRLSPLVADAARALLPYIEDVPFALFGHSVGALVSFELARLLRRQYHRTPVHLFIASHRAPHRPDPNPPIHGLPEAEFLRELRRYNGTPEVILQNPELLELLVPNLRADFAVFETYGYTRDAPLDCPISAFGGRQDAEVSVADIEAWHEQTTSRFTMRLFPGDHFFLHAAQADLLQAICEELFPGVQAAKSVTGA
jgi:medium-chain acyl-[acyl-carrier-protein] hydrolase